MNTFPHLKIFPQLSWFIVTLFLGHQERDQGWAGLYPSPFRSRFPSNLNQPEMQVIKSKDPVQCTQSCYHASITAVSIPKLSHPSVINVERTFSHMTLTKSVTFLLNGLDSLGKSRQDLGILSNPNPNTETMWQRRGSQTPVLFLPFTFDT